MLKTKHSNKLISYLILGSFLLALMTFTFSAIYAAPPDAVMEPQAICADLVVTDFDINPAPPTVGKNATIDVTVLNQGTCATLSFVVQWKSDRFAATGPSTFVNGLAAGASTTVSFEYAFPRVGDFTTVVNVDTQNTVEETNENNNLEIFAITVAPDLPDLRVENFTVNPAKPVAGLNGTIAIKIRNAGTLDAGSFVVQWKQSQFSPTGPSQPVTSLAAGAVTTVVFDYSYPNAGNYQSQVNLDTANTVAESNESNNLEILPITVQKAFVDLVITEDDFKIVPETPVRGRLATASITVKNEGNFPSDEFTVEWKPTLFGSPYAKQIDGLAPGASKTVTFEHNYPLDGDFFTSATADSTNRIKESDETNNKVTKPITVDPPRPDLEITNISISPAQPVRTVKSTTTIEVTNTGNSPAGVFVVEWKATQLGPAYSQQVNGLGVGESAVLKFDHTYNFAGEFVSVAEADSTKRVLELDEKNNTKELEVQVLADTVDLIVSKLSIKPNNPTLQNKPAKVDIVVTNLGNSPSGSFIVEWNPDALGLIIPSPSTLSEQVDNLGAGQSKTVSFMFTYTQAGNFRSVAEVDGFNKVKEANEANNQKILNVQVGQVAPDLTITQMTVFEDRYHYGCDQDEGPRASPLNMDIVEPKLTQGRNVAICIMVANQGNRDAGPFVVEWNPDAFEVITPSPGTISTQIDELGVGESTLVEFNFIYHAFGNFRTVAKVDAFNNVAETNEANNLDLVNVVVDPAPIDLRITGFTINPTSPTRASTATASITVRNYGEYPAGDFWVQWKLTGEKSGGPFVMVDGLNPNESKTVQVEGSFLQAGNFTSQAVADVFDQVVETNEDNNTKDISVTVQKRMTKVRVTFTNIKVVEALEDGLVCTDITPCDGEWVMIFAVLNPDAECNLYGETIPGVSCSKKEDGSVDDGDNINPGVSYDITLIESAPLVLGSLALEVDDFIGIPTGADFLGYVLAVHTAQDNYGSGSPITVDGEEGECSPCYRLTYKVEIVSAPPAVAAGEELPPTETVHLPAGWSKLIPPEADLPDNVTLTYETFLPGIVNQE